MPALDRPRREKKNGNSSKFSPDPPRKSKKKKAVPKQVTARKPRVSTNAAHLRRRSARPVSVNPSDHSEDPLWYLADLAAEIPGGVGSPPNRGGNLQTRENVDGRDVGERVRLTREAIALEVSRLDDLRRARLGLRDLRERRLSLVAGEGVRAEELLAAIARLEEAWRAFLARNEVRWSDQLRRDGESQVEARRRQRATEARVARLEGLAKSLARERADAAHASPVTPATGTRATNPIATFEGRECAPFSRTPPWKG
ncbi:predicted protein [Micromonas commoda]|uniref:Uncharacterized protein n=1 Tax=Micromonas commoda (strain RCC299 / NOUM17 / CCMP2709) TaxID=296587 RepID=C1ED70_MICCC|nr:predicted protein [Micromonas commoda]ACO65388.1 predicted protein [Micromonas commoda]|eukprot:XP_002504130.1 predicted protein [Micromonas commoda]